MSNYYDELASVSSSSNYSNVMDDEELDLLIGMLEEMEDFDVGDFDEISIDFHSKDIKTFSDLDVATIFKSASSTKPYINKLKTKVDRIKPGTRLYRMLSDEKFIGNEGVIICKNGTAIYHSSGEKCLVGSSKIDCEILVNGNDLFKLADAYVEEVKGKGSGFGFSMHCHLLAVMSLRVNDGYIEPLEGCDYTVKGGSVDYPITVEITGMNYKSRNTSANVILNKYLLLQSISECPKVSRTMTYSNYEETGVNDFLKNSNHYQGDSEYTPTFDETHNLLRKMKEPQFKSIFEHVKRWLNLDMKLSQVKPEDTIEFEIHGSKGDLYPAPFRVKSMQHDVRLEIVKPEASLWRDNSGIDWYAGRHGTFHTCKGDVDYIKMCSMRSEIITVNCEHLYTVDDNATNILEKYQAIQSLRISYELFDKIQGIKGQYYSVKNGVGICWSTTGKECLTYNCAFYGSEKPDEGYFGTWSNDEYLVGFKDSEGRQESIKFYRSPGFKVSRQDISYYNKIYACIITMYTSVHNSSDKEEVETIENMMPIYTSLVANSSWMTSSYSDNTRFTTTGHLSGNCVKNLMIKPLIKGRPIRNCEFLYYKLVERFINNTPLRTVTPLLRLPIKFISLEKDLGLAMNWRNRQADHETECCRKIIERSIEEREAKEDVIDYYKKVNEYLDKLVKVGVSYSETRDLLDLSVPDPIMNPVFYIACCYACRSEINLAGASQQSTGFSLNDMVSDRGSFKIENDVGKDSKVVSEIRSLVHKHEITGPYDGLFKIFDEKIEHTYLIRSKNGRGRREFATQTIIKRYEQNFEEKLASGISLAAPDDQFLNPHKYNEMVMGFINILKSEKPVSGSSEDRKNHCGHNHPEGIAVACHIHAIVNNVPYFHTLTAIKRCNTYRWCILPENFDESKISCKGLETKYIKYLSRNKFKMRKMIKVYKHGMQGMGAIIAGVTNTTSVKGTIKMINDSCYEEDYLFTTQDDVGRAVVHRNECNPTIPENNYLRKPVETLKFTLQENNERKFVTITHDKAHLSLVEVNNIAITGNGMLRQEYIHPFINIQPFTSDSIVSDLMSCVSNARQSIFWGDSPTTAMSCYNNGLRSLRSKWMLDQDEINFLREIKFLPIDSNELISGFYPRTVESMKLFVNMMSDEELEKVEGDEKSLFTGACRQYSKQTKKIDEDPKTILKTKMRTFDHKSETIYNQRRMKGRLSSSFVKPMLFKTRLTIKNNFMKAFENVPRSVEKCEEMLSLAPPVIQGFLKPMRTEHKLPCMMGEVVGHQKLNRKALICKKVIGCNYRTEMTDEEKEVLRSENFWELMMKEMRYLKEEGFQVHSPSGLPVVRFLDGKLFSKPQSYNFKIRLNRPAKDARPFTYRGINVDRFRPILYGGASIAHAKGTLCFGRGYMDGEEYVFYKAGQKGKLSHRKVEDDKSLVVNVTEGEGESFKNVCFYINFEDWSPFRHTYRRHVAGIESDPTAILNYGGFLRSNSELGFPVLREIFEKNESYIPSFVDRHMPDYPRFHNDAIEIKCNNLNLIGNRHISKVKHVPCGITTKYYEISNGVNEVNNQSFVM